MLVGVFVPPLVCGQITFKNKYGQTLLNNLIDNINKRTIIKSTLSCIIQ